MFYFVSFVISFDKIQAPTLALNIADLLILWIWYKYIRRLVSCPMHFHSRPPGESLNPSTSGMWTSKYCRKFKHVEWLVELITHYKTETFIKLGGNGFAIMGKLNVVILRYLSRDDFRVLTAVCIQFKEAINMYINFSSSCIFNNHLS